MCNAYLHRAGSSKGHLYELQNLVGQDILVVVQVEGYQEALSIQPGAYRHSKNGLQSITR